MKNYRYSILALSFIFVFLLSVFFYFDIWNANRIIVDVPSYYTYLPAFIIHHDLHLDYIDKDPSFYQDKVWYYKVEGGRKLIKHPLGISAVLSPFFLIGHWIAGMKGDFQDGYSMPYQNALSFGVLFYLFTGIFFLRKILLGYFSDKVTAFTLIAVVLGTNLLWYSTFEALMPHAISFSLWCAAIYFFFNWLETQAEKFILLFGIVFGLIVLIRPLSIISILFFLIYGIIRLGGLKTFIIFLKPKWKIIIPATFISFSIVSLQLFYWKYSTGKWFYDPYINEHFIFKSPQVFPFLFSFRKGLFIYTPVMVFAIIGLVQLRKLHRALLYSTVFFMAVTVFLLASWWAWSYGFCWGMRPMIDYYALLSIPMAAGFNELLKRSTFTRIIFYTSVSLFIFLNLFQTWQYKNGLIHYDDMSREAYFKGFFQTEISAEWLDLLKPYDWDRRIKGLPQIDYSKSIFDQIPMDQNICFKGSNFKYVIVNHKALNAMASLSDVKNEQEESFHIMHLNDSTLCISSEEKLLWSLRTDYSNAITASATSIGVFEKFIIVYPDADDNKIAIKAANGKYITIGSQWPFILTANSESISRNEIFRYFLITN